MRHDALRKSLRKIENNGLLDLLCLGILYVVIFNIWRVCFGWDGAALLLTEDGIFHHYPTLREILDHSEPLSYHFASGGGIALYPVTGLVSLEAFFYKAGMDLTSAINTSLLMFQTLSVYFLIKFISLWRKISWSDWVFGTFLLGFSPVLVVRFRAGHVNFLLASTLVSCGLYLATLVSKLKRPNPVELIITLFTLSQVFGYITYQGDYYTLLTLLPVCALILGFQKNWGQLLRALGAACLILLVSLACSTLEIKAVLHHFASGEITRNLSDKLAVFSYFQPTLTSWASSLFYSVSTISSEFATFLHHEISYPFCLLLFGFGVLALKRKHRLKLFPAGVISFVFLFLVSLNLPGFTNLMITLIPGLGSFRVIQRFMIPEVLLWSSILVLLIRAKERILPREFLTTVIVLISSALIVHLSPEFDYFLEALTAGTFLLSFRFRRMELFALALLTGISFAGAIERAPAFPPLNLETSRLVKTRNIGSNPLIRAELSTSTPLLPNTGMLLGIPMGSYYSNPPKSYLDLLQSFTHHDETYRMATDFNNPHSPAFLKALYNISFEVSHQGEFLVGVPSSIPSVPVRIPTKIRDVPRTELPAISSNVELTADYLYQTLDTGILLSPIPGYCKDLKYEFKRADLEEIRIQLTGESNQCYLVLPLNFSYLIDVEGIAQSGSRIKMNTFISHKTLLGIGDLRGVQEVVVRPKVLFRYHDLVIEKLLGLLLGVALYFYLGFHFRKKT